MCWAQTGWRDPNGEPHRTRVLRPVSRLPMMRAPKIADGPTAGRFGQPDRHGTTTYGDSGRPIPASAICGAQPLKETPLCPQTVPASRRVSDSAVEMPQLVLPQHANVHGSVLGGMVMHWVDLAAALVANRHSRRPVVTAAFDEMAFLAPIQVGQLALLRAKLTLVDRSSMEIRVDVQSEDLLTGEHQKTGTAFVTFVALDPVSKCPTP